MYLFYSFIGLEQRIGRTVDKTSAEWNVGQEYTLCTKMIAIIPQKGPWVAKKLDEVDDRILEVYSLTERVRGENKRIKAIYHEDQPTFPDKKFSNQLLYITMKQKVWNRLKYSIVGIYWNYKSLSLYS